MQRVIVLLLLVSPALCSRRMSIKNLLNFDSDKSAAAEELQVSALRPRPDSRSALARQSSFVGKSQLDALDVDCAGKLIPESVGLERSVSHRRFPFVRPATVSRNRSASSGSIVGLVTPSRMQPTGAVEASVHTNSTLKALVENPTGSLKNMKLLSELIDGHRAPLLCPHNPSKFPCGPVQVVTELHSASFRCTQCGSNISDREMEIMLFDNWDLIMRRLPYPLRSSIPIPSKNRITAAKADISMLRMEIILRQVQAKKGRSTFEAMIAAPPVDSDDESSVSSGFFDPQEQAASSGNAFPHVSDLHKDMEVSFESRVCGVQPLLPGSLSQLSLNNDFHHNVATGQSAQHAPAMDVSSSSSETLDVVN